MYYIRITGGDYFHEPGNPGRRQGWGTRDAALKEALSLARAIRSVDLLDGSTLLATVTASGVTWKVPMKGPYQ